MSAAQEGAPPRVLFTVPVKNEESQLVPTLLSLKRAFDAAEFSYKLSVAEDGSTDGTKQILPRLAALIPGIVVQDHSLPLGRGRALRNVWSALDADIYGFCDADLAAGVDDVVEAIRLAQSGSEIVIGSRYVAGARVSRPPLRSFVSIQYNALLRFGFGSTVRDHQCGLKVFRAGALQRLLPLTVEDSWFWDTEVLVMAQQIGIRIREMPVDWEERRVSYTPLTRLLSDLYLHGTGMLRLKARVTMRREATAYRGRPASSQSDSIDTQA